MIRRPAPVFIVIVLFLLSLRVDGSVTAQQHAMHHVMGDSLVWRMPMTSMSMPMLPGVADYIPPLTPFLPGQHVDADTLPLVQPREIIDLDDGDTLQLDARLVRKQIGGRSVVMYGFNGQHPGPFIRVQQHATVTVQFRNNIDMPTTIHWHGLRLDNAFDGVPGLTQDAVEPGGSFQYTVRFPDAGVYWYHPHVREDIQQELGLYGNMLVRSPHAEYFNPVNVEEALILDDLLMDAGRPVPFGLEGSNYTLMGRFGNTFLLNGEPDYSLEVHRGDVVRFLLTNVSNTRNFNVVFGDAPLKVVGADVGLFEREEWIQSVPIAPAQRYIVEARFERPGRFPVTNRVQAIDHFLGEYFASVDTLGWIVVSGESSAEDYGGLFQTLRVNHDTVTDIDRYRSHFDRAPDREFDLTVRVGELPAAVIQFMSIDTTYFPPVEWSDAMPMMNWVANSSNVEWVIRDRATGDENMAIDVGFHEGDVVKLRFFNDPKSFHPMSHPIHLHGQRFLVLERDGSRNPNLVWKDTFLVPVGAMVDVLVDLSNPGEWMFHCHIAEHLEAGMMSKFSVTPNTERN